MKLTLRDVEGRVARLGDAKQAIYKAMERLLDDPDGLSKVTAPMIAQQIKAASVSDVTATLRAMERTKLVFHVSMLLPDGSGTQTFWNTYAHAHGLVRGGKAQKESAEVGNLNFRHVVSSHSHQETDVMSTTSRRSRRSKSTKPRTTSKSTSKSTKMAGTDKEAAILAAVKAGAHSADELVKATKIRLTQVRPLAMAMAQSGALDAQKVSGSWVYALPGKLPKVD